MNNSRGNRQLRKRLHDIIFEADTPKGKLFDEILLILIVLSVVAASIETVPNVSESVIRFIHILEWIFTIIFTIEYFLRIYIVLKPVKYITSFYGVVDLLAILPTYISIFVAGTQSLIIIRALRLLRIFRIFKMGHYINSSQIIMRSLKLSLPKITVFMYFILVVVCIFGAVMYLVEGATNPTFDSIPRSVYWAIVTVTTVGYGDISPTTFIGQFLSAILMIMGYAIIAVPTGIISADMFFNSRRNDQLSTQSCRFCSSENHHPEAKYCKDCGELLNPDEVEDDLES